MNVKVLAMTASATPACAARADRAPSMRAPLASLPDSAGALAEADGAELEEELALRDTAATGALVGELGTTAGVTEEAEPDAGTLEVLFEPVLLPPGRYDGGATALDGSVRAAVPQGIA